MDWLSRFLVVALCIFLPNLAVATPGEFAISDCCYFSAGAGLESIDLGYSDLQVEHPDDPGSLPSTGEVDEIVVGLPPVDDVGFDFAPSFLVVSEPILPLGLALGALFLLSRLRRADA